MEKLQQSLDNLATVFKGRMQEFQEDLSKASNPDTVSSLTVEYNGFKRFVMAALGALQQQVLLLRQQQDITEMRSRRKMLLFHGVVESKQEDIASVIAKVIVERLKVSNFTTENITRGHRLGKSATGKPRPILVKLSTQSLRDRVWFSKTELKGSGLTISEFLTKGRHDAILAARERFGVAKCWTRDGFIHIISPDGSKHRISSLAEVNALMNSSETATAPKPSSDAAAVAQKSPNAVAGVPRPTPTSSAAGHAAAVRPKRTASKK